MYRYYPDVRPAVPVSDVLGVPARLAGMGWLGDAIDSRIPMVIPPNGAARP